MRFILPLAIAGAVMLAVSFGRSQAGGGGPPRTDTSRDPEPVRTAKEADGAPCVVPARAPHDAAPATAPLPAEDRPPSTVNWSRDLGTAMERARANGRLILIYVGPHPDT